MGTDVTGLFERALGEEWDELHPRIRDRYGLVAGESREAVGRGRMSRLTRSALALPMLWLGTAEDFLFPESGADVPFTITTEAFVDGNGREALFLRRQFETEPAREFVDTLRWNAERDCITDFFGRNGRIAADLHLSARDGDLSLALGTQWLRLAGRYLALPGPLSVETTLRDGYDDDDEEFRVAAEITNPLIGQVFGYRGTFENEFRDADANAPTSSSLVEVELPAENA